MFDLLGGLALQLYSTRVSAAPTVSDASAVSVVELGQPGEASGPSAHKVSLAEVLVGQPGLQLRSAGGLGQYSGAILRGADANQVAVLIDGVPLLRGAQSAVDLSQLPVDGVERVEIYRGVPPFEAGIDAIGGAINLISRRGRGDSSLWALLGSGSFGLRKVSLGHSGEQGGVRVSATLSYQGASGDFPYLSTGGLLYTNQLLELLRRNDGFDQLAVDVRLSGEAAHGSYYLAAHGLLKQQGVPGIGQAEAQPGQPQLSVGRALLSGGGQAQLLPRRVELLIDGHALLERSAIQDLQLEPPSKSDQLSQQVGARALLRLHGPVGEGPLLGRERQTLLALADLRYEHLGSSDLCPAPRSDCSQVAPTASQRLRGLLGLGGELRFGSLPPPASGSPLGEGDSGGRLLIAPAVHLLLSRSNLLPLAGSPTGSGQAVSSDEVFLAPRLAARLKLRPWLLLRASGGRFVRLPTFLELFGDRAFFRSNLALRPESAWLVELGGRASGTVASLLRLSLEAHGFARQVSDLIDTIRDGATLRAANVGEALSAGLELEGRAQLRELLSLQLTYTFLDARNRTSEPGKSGNLLPGRPPHSLFLRLDLGYRRWRLGYELDYTSLLYLDPANLLPRPARALHALLLSAGPYAYGRSRLTLSVELRNLADTRALPVVLPLGAGERLVPLSDIYDYPLPGRALYATLVGRL